MKLTHNQEKYALLLFQGVKQCEAWGQAGYSTNYPSKDTDSHASNLANSDKIKTRLAELNNMSNSSIILSKQQRLEKLSTIATEGNTKLSSPVEAIKEINKMMGDYAPIRHQVAAKVIFEVRHIDYKGGEGAIQRQEEGSGGDEALQG